MINNLSKNKNLKIICGSRTLNKEILTKNLTQFFLGDFSEGKIVWPKEMKIDIVIHTITKQEDNEKKYIKKINTDVQDLAIKALKMGKKIYFLSSIKFMVKQTQLIVV